MFNPPNGLWLAPHVYNHTLYGPSTPNGTSSNWNVAQWGTPSGDLPAFGTYRPNATWNDPLDFTFANNGWNDIVDRGTNAPFEQPCNNELDAFDQPNNADYPSYPQAAPGALPTLDTLSNLTHTFTLRVNNYYLHDANCAATQSFVQSSFILSNPSHGQTFFFQIMLWERRMSTNPLWWATGAGGQWGYTQTIPNIVGGTMPTGYPGTWSYNFDVLPQLKTAIAYAAAHYGMDGTLADWDIGGAYVGPAVWGHALVDMSWQNWSLTY